LPSQSRDEIYNNYLLHPLLSKYRYVVATVFLSDGVVTMDNEFSRDGADKKKNSKHLSHVAKMKEHCFL
jgi:hypothetical protein